MKSIDLFSGCGGLSKGLRGVFVPVAYCEADPHCRAVLKARMRDGGLDRAPIHGDVRSFPGTRAHAVVGGFPCQDISSCGTQRGLEGARSGLFYSLMEVVRSSGCRYVVLENVAKLASMPRVWRGVLAALHKQGFDCVWGVVAAAHVGAPHLRKRWFCLATRRGCEPLRVPPYTPPPWRAEPPVRLAQSTRERRRRIKMLGNICLPQQARLALSLLAAPPADGVCVSPTRRLPAWGALRQGRIYKLPTPSLQTRALDLVLVPYGGVPARATRTVIQAPVRLKLWGTPRAGFGGSAGIARTLTARTRGDLPTQARFERGTPDAQRELNCLNPEWVEWMCGVPEGWTHDAAPGHTLVSVPDTQD